VIARVSLRQVNTSCWRSQCAAFGRSYVHAALEAGASGLLKERPVGRLVEAVRLVASGEALLAPTVA
jgi:DNA-binding NarL/FixJ family response regulator